MSYENVPVDSEWYPSLHSFKDATVEKGTEIFPNEQDPVFVMNQAVIHF